MQRRLLLQRTLRCLLLLVLAAVPPLVAAEPPVRLAPEAVDPLQALLDKGRRLESQRRWSEALTYYEDAVRSHPRDWRLRERLDQAKIQHSLGRRYSDTSFLDALTAVPLDSALDLYSEVALKIDSHYVTTPSWRKLVDRGTASLDTALSQPQFLDYQLHDAQPDQIARFRQELYRTTAQASVRSRFDARNVVAQVARLANSQLRISPTAVVFEYICGATGGLDNYSTFLTGSQLRDIYAQIEGNFVGLGVELQADAGTLRIDHVIPGSPAERAGIRAQDRIIAVNGRATKELSTDQAAALLQGPEGSIADVTLVTLGSPPRRLRLRREHVDVPSIEGDRIVDQGAGIGYLRLTSFQKDTSHDLDAALWKLQRQGMRSLILDLRRNPGGLLTAAVEIADKFIQQGNLVSTSGRNRQESFRYDAHRPGTWRVPLVVLIDGDSASASEIFAGAIRYYHRGTIVGCRSYGKGSVQGIFPLSTAGTGIRLTTAKFYAPGGQPISNIGVSPDIVVRQTAKATSTVRGKQVDSGDAVLRAGIMAARRNLASR